MKEARGFDAELRGVGLWDLVQMECLAGSRGSVKVTGDGGTGYLYFDRGRIVHASCGDRVGEAAAIEILGWSNGSFQPAERPWPARPTIATSHEALILQAAKIRDESGPMPALETARSPARPRSAPAKLVAFPAGGPVSPAPGDELELVELEEEIMSEEPPTPGPRPESTGEISSPFQMMLRIGRNGAIVSNRGGSEEAADTIAYVHRLSELAGELLGLEDLVALECVFKEGRCIVFSEPSGEIVAVRPKPDASLQALREKLGL